MQVRIIEMKETEVGFVTTGEEIHMEEDSPLFAAMGPQGVKAVEMGHMMLGGRMFQEIKLLVKASGL